MKHFAKWTFLLVMAGLIGFSATVLASQSARLAQILSQDATPELLTGAEEPFLEEAQLASNAGSDSTVPAAALAESLPAAAESADLLAAAGIAPIQVQTGAALNATEPAVLPQTAGSQVSGGVLNAVGTIEVAHGRQVVLSTGGQVKEIAVEVGDQVQAGDLLIALDTTQLDWALEQAEISFETARINFEELGETVRESDVALAEANLLLAQENLAVAQQGPTPEELAAAQAAAQGAWARYEELQAQPTQAQINQALATLRRAEISVQGAQREYDRIAWLPESSASAAADALQRATIDLEAAQAAFDEVNRPARESELQGALSTAQNAQATLNRLRQRPTAAEVADAEARLAAAEAAYEQALLGPEESALRIGELSLRQAMIGLEQARLNLENAQVRAPIDGTVLSLNVDLGQQASGGTVVATLANPLDVRLVVNVEQRDIRMVSIGQGVEISIYALPDVTFLGVVNKIAPIAGSSTGFVTFPVIIELVDGPIERVLPGMTAAAAFLPQGGSQSSEEAGEEAAEEAAPAATPVPTEEPEEEPEAESTAEPTAEPEEESAEEAEEDSGAEEETGEE